MSKKSLIVISTLVITSLFIPMAVLASNGDPVMDSRYYRTNIDADDGINLQDFASFAAQWLLSGCTDPDWCNGADLDQSGDVGFPDLLEIAEHWLDGVYLASYYLDDFNDNTMGPIWTLMASNESHCWLDETNQRLEIRAAPESDNDIALYVPNEWHLDTLQNFGFKIRFHNEVESTTWSELLFALGDSLNVEDNHLQFSVCSLDDWGYSGPYFYYQLVQNGSQIDELYTPRFSFDGWIFISYDAELDEIYFGIDGYGPAYAIKTVTGLLQGDWAGKQIAPHIGGSSDHVEMLSGQAYWDDLIVDYGQIIYE